MLLLAWLVMQLLSPEEVTLPTCFFFFLAEPTSTVPHPVPFLGSWVTVLAVVLAVSK